MIDPLISDFSLLSKIREQDRTLSLSVVKKNYEAEPWVYWYFANTPYIASEINELVDPSPPRSYKHLLTRHWC